MNFEKPVSEDFPIIYNYSYSDNKKKQIGLSDRGFKDRADLLAPDSLVKTASQQFGNQNKTQHNTPGIHKISKHYNISLPSVVFTSILIRENL